MFHKDLRQFRAVWHFAGRWRLEGADQRRYFKRLIAADLIIRSIALDRLTILTARNEVLNIRSCHGHKTQGICHHTGCRG